MSRKRKRSKAKHKPTRPFLPKPSVSIWRSVFLSTKFWLGTLSLGLAALGIILWWPFYIPSIHIDIASSSNNPLRPIPPSFTIANRGVLGAYDLEFQCYYIHIRTVHGFTINGFSEGLKHLADILHGGQSIDAQCPSLIETLASGSDIEIFAAFSPAFTWKQSYTCARFTIQENSHGQLQWFRKNKCSFLK